MPEKDKKKSSSNRVSDQDRFKFIGFEVFPGKPKDLFKSDAEKKKLMDEVRQKRDSGDILRDCSLMEERINMSDRITLTVASVVIFITLFIPWYGLYNEIEEITTVPTPVDSTAVAAVVVDSLATDSLGIALVESDSAILLSETAVEEEPSEVAVVEDTVEASEERPDAAVASRSTAEEVIHGYVAKKKVHKEVVHKSGLGALISIGSVGGSMFSSGFVLILTAVIFLFYTLLSIGLPAYTLYGIFGVKGDADEKALELKKILRYNWIPLCLFVLALLLSFFGADYGFDSVAAFSSLGDSYSVGVFMDSLSWGILVSLAAFVLVAAKGSEI
ncbi:MAG: hypothetical protein KOO62_07090 [candidate division Zixibacteria bacterium]|nr:hypothetical protein [candidate division Zixibacteria bacterium]